MIALDFQRFLDDSKIIKKQPQEIQNVIEEETPITEEPKPRKRTKPKKQETPVPPKQEEQQPKTRKQIIIELIDRFNAQLITKEVELALSQEMYKVANNNDERKRYDMVAKNMAKDIKELKQKISILEKMHNG